MRNAVSAGARLRRLLSVRNTSTKAVDSPYPPEPAFLVGFFSGALCCASAREPTNKKVAESEVWQFHLDQNKISNSTNNWYVDVDNYDSKSTYYFRGDQIGIKLRNFNKENELSFRIKDGKGVTIMDNKSISLAALEDGTNYYIIDIKNKFKTNMPHQLEVFGNRKKQVINLIKTN